MRIKDSKKKILKIMQVCVTIGICILLLSGPLTVTAENKKTSSVDFQGNEYITDVMIPPLIHQEIKAPDTKNYLKFSFQDCIYSSEPGMPCVPQKRLQVHVPSDAHDIQISVLRSHEQKLNIPFDIYPVEKEILQNDEDCSWTTSEFYIDEEFYHNSGEFYPKDLVEINNLANIRGFRYVDIRVSPVQYQPLDKTLVFADELTVKVTWQSNQDMTPSDIGEPFQQIIQDLDMLNYHPPASQMQTFRSGQVSYLTSTGLANPSNSAEYLIVYANCFYGGGGRPVQILQDFATYRASQRGYNVAVVNVDEIYTAYDRQNIPHYPELIDADDYEEDRDLKIKTLIKYAYENWDQSHNLTYVLLVGDPYPGTAPFFIPFHTNFIWFFNPALRGVTDYWYGTLNDDNDDGIIDDGDYFADVLIGRFSVQTLEELSIVVQKTINFENTPPAGWKSTALVASGFDYEQEDNNKMDEAREQFLVPHQIMTNSVFAHEYSNTRQGYAEAKADTIRYLNAGCGLFAHNSHGCPEHWRIGYDGIHSDFGTNDVRALTNGEMTPVVLSLSCSTADCTLSDGSCIGEVFLNTANKGAVAYFGATRKIATATLRMILDILDAILNDEVYILGASLLWGIINYSGHTQSIHYILIGDPALSYPILPPRNVYVDDNWDGPNNDGGHEWGINAFNAITPALENVSNNGIVNVYEGTYSENPNTGLMIEINKQITLLGAGSDRTTILTENSNQIILSITTDSVVVSGFTIIYDGPEEFGGLGIEILSNCDNICIQNNIIEDMTIGISIGDSRNHFIYRNIIRNNGYVGVIAASDLNQIYRNTFENNGYYWEAYGLFITGEDSVIYHNNFIDNFQQAYSVGSNQWNCSVPSVGGNYWSNHHCHGNPSNDPYRNNGVTDDHPFEERDGWDNNPSGVTDQLLMRLPAFNPDTRQPSQSNILDHLIKISYTTTTNLYTLIPQPPKEAEKTNTPTITKVSYPTNLANHQNMADYLIITADEFTNNTALNTFARYRAQNSKFNVAIVSTSKIYEAVGTTIPPNPHIIGTGDNNALSIKNFINYALTHWNNGKTPILHVLLVGDAHPPNASYYLPLWMSTYTDYCGNRIPGDYPYSCQNDNNGDGNIDNDDLTGILSIGRFSVHNNTELQAIIDKTISFENPPAQQKTRRTDVLLTHAAGAGLPSKYLVYNSLPYIRDTEILPNGGTVTEVYMENYSTIQQGKIDLINKINQGHSVLTFEGHSGGGWFLGNNTFFRGDDISALTNKNMTPFVCGMTCFSAIIDFDHISHAELFTNIPKTGAVGYLGASRATIPYKNALLLKEIMHSIFQHGTHTLGEIVLVAKLHLQDDAVENRLQYSLIGDPALNIKQALKT
ncbi:MAG: C25 family cysteine peptidase [Methanobacteriota archaeon]